MHMSHVDESMQVSDFPLSSCLHSFSLRRMCLLHAAATTHAGKAYKSFTTRAGDVYKSRHFELDDDPKLQQLILFPVAWLR